MPECGHINVTCLNHYDIIRKYRCDDCGAVMMCACDEELGRRCLSHQIGRTRDPETGSVVAVTAGFVKGVCNACRGLHERPHPKKATYGRTSKFVRYYWREIQAETLMRFQLWAEEHGYKHWTTVGGDRRAIRDAIDQKVIEEVKARYEHHPKYRYDDESAHNVLSRHGVEVVPLTGAHEHRDGRLVIVDGPSAFTPEEYAGRHFGSLGYQWLSVESVPLHALFGVFMWILVEDPGDERVRPVMFGDRRAFDRGEKNKTVTTLLPGDFGKSSYYTRRLDAIEAHLDSLRVSKNELLWLYDYWGDDENSGKFRQYLWAHRKADVETARRLVEILPEETIVGILGFLVQSYWARYLGWPDLLVYRDGDFFFAEVKSSRDKLSGDQKDWIRANESALHLPFKLVKIHRLAS